METVSCAICHQTVRDFQKQRQHKNFNGNYYDCPNCGKYLIGNAASRIIHFREEGVDEDALAILSHEIWQRQNTEDLFWVSEEVVRKASDKDLPVAEKQLDLLIRYLGDNQKSPGKHLEIPVKTLRAKIGAVDDESEEFVIQSGVDEGLVDDSQTTITEYGIRLTPAGQKRYRALKIGNAPPEEKESNSQEDDDLSMKTTVSPEVIERIWGAAGQERVRLFLSHKAGHKENVSSLKEKMALYGICAFVAHEDIEPTQEWQEEIERALKSMDVLVALLTDDFRDSNWTDHEVGFALGRGVPVIAVRLGMDPYGFIGNKQGLSGCSWSDIWTMADKIYCLLHKQRSHHERLFLGAIHAYTTSATYLESTWNVEHVLARFKSINDEQADEVARAFSGNSQNYGAHKGKRKILELLNGWTGDSWELKHNALARSVKTG